MPGVHDGAFWLPDDVADGVVRPVAFVVAPELTARDVIAGLRDRLEPAFVPRRVVLLAELPREATGKITAATLRALAVRHLPDDDAGVTIPVDHPAFDGHFPGQPILPGVVLLTLVMGALEQQPALKALLGATPVIDAVKFLAPVAPGARLTIDLNAQGRGVGFELRQGVRAVARGKLAPGG